MRLINTETGDRPWVLFDGPSVLRGFDTRGDAIIWLRQEVRNLEEKQAEITRELTAICTVLRWD